MSKTPPQYEYERKVYVAGRGDVYLGKYPSNFDLKIGCRIFVDGEEMTVRGIEYFSNPFRALQAGDSVGVLLSRT